MEKTVPVQRDYTLRNQLSILLAVFLLTAVTFHLVEIPSYTLRLGNIFGSSLSLSLGAAWALAGCLSLLTLTGTYALVRQHPAWEQRPAGWWLSLILPTLTAFTMSLLLNRIATGWAWVRMLGLAIGVTGTLVYLTYRAFVLTPERAAFVRMIFNIADYALAFVVLEALMRDAGRGVVLIPAAALLQGLLALDMLRVAPVTRRTFLYAALTALTAGELAWALSYWPLMPRVAGIWLTLNLYVIAGLGGTLLNGPLERRTVFSFLSLALIVGLAALVMA